MNPNPYTYKSDKPGCLSLIGTVIGAIALFIVALVALVSLRAVVFLFLWNVLVGMFPQYNLPRVDFWQSLVIVWLLSFIGSPSYSRGSKS